MNNFITFSAEYPWQVAILKKEEFDNVYVCGGALIDGSHILTAAHSIKDYKPQDLRYLYISFILKYLPGYIAINEMGFVSLKKPPLKLK